MTYSNSISEFLSDFYGYGEQTALIWRDNAFSYSHILKRISYWRHKLNNIPVGSIVGLESDFSPETIAILFVLIELNLIIVPLDINHTDKNEKKIVIAQLDCLIRVNSEDKLL